MTLVAAALPLSAQEPTRDATRDATLALRLDDSTHVFWRESSAPTRWIGPDAAVTRALAWRRTTSDAIVWAELELQARGVARRTRVVVVRIDPARARFDLVQRTSGGGEAPGWTIGDAPDDAIVALNAGQFTGVSPWGWVVRDGTERLSPGRGPLSSAMVVTRAGGAQGTQRVHWVDGDSLEGWRSRTDVVSAFQSYPTLLVGDGAIPALLGAVSRTQRDARLAIGLDRDGRVLLALTRFDALGGALDFAPFGLTTPEMAALMGALGARQAMLLDGGISAQLLLRTPAGTERWSGLRRVPLALLVRDAGPAR